MFLPLRLNEEDDEILKNIEDYKDKINKCVHSLIILGQERAPVKKADLNRVAFSINLHYRSAGVILLAANKELNKNFGMRVFEFADKTKYILVNSETDFAQYYDDENQVRRELTVLYFVLMGIFVSPDERMTTEEMEKSLKPMKISSEAMKEYLDLFVRKMYLKLERQQEVRLYGWGERAVAEVDPEKFFQRFLDLAEETSDKAWPDLRKRAEKLNELRFGPAVAR